MIDAIGVAVPEHRHAVRESITARLGLEIPGDGDAIRPGLGILGGFPVRLEGAMEPSGAWLPRKAALFDQICKQLKDLSPRS
ncbi:MAG: hypothetical protein ACREXW_13170 [Gammaproteobacteria bacterium]